jgi:hypothetical protein
MTNDLVAEQRRQNKKLEVFLGKWHTVGQIYEDYRVTGEVDAIDTYEWLAGQYAMIHYADSNMGVLKIHSIEIIGYDPSRKAFFGPFFDDQGSAGWEEIRFENNTWIWNGENVMGVKYHRCKASFQDKNTITAMHEHSNDRMSWKKWIDITLSKME